MIELNKVLIVGRLTRDPETRYTTGGQAVANFAVAVNRRFKGRDGDRREEVAYVDCEAWGKSAEFIQQWFGKGKAIFVEGRLKQDSWEDRSTGQKRSKLLVSVDRASFVSGDRDGDEGGSGGGGGGSRSGGGGYSRGDDDSYDRGGSSGGSGQGGGGGDSFDEADSTDDDLPF